MSIQGLIEQEGDANDYVKDYCSHNYPQSSPNYDLAALMSHSGIASQIAPYAAEVAAAAAAGKSHVFGETNSGTPSPRFGDTFLIISSYARWRRYQPDIRSGTVDCGLCDAAGDHGHGCMNSTQPGLTVTDNFPRQFTSTRERSETASTAGGDGTPPEPPTTEPTSQR